MKQKNESIMEKDEENIDVNNFDIDELIERPRVSSVPKININNQKGEDNYQDDDYDDNFADNNIPLYNINLMEYGTNLQRYLKEKNRILHDEDYRRNIMVDYYQNSQNFLLHHHHYYLLLFFIFFLFFVTFKFKYFFFFIFQNHIIIAFYIYLLIMYINIIWTF